MSVPVQKPSPDYCTAFLQQQHCWARRDVLVAAACAARHKQHLGDWMSPESSRPEPDMWISMVWVRLDGWHLEPVFSVYTTYRWMASGTCIFGIYHVYTSYIPCICRCPTCTWHIYGISMDIPCTYHRNGYTWLSMDIPCMSTQYIHGISMDINGYTWYIIWCIYMVYTWYIHGYSWIFLAFWNQISRPARVAGLIRCAHVCGYQNYNFSKIARIFSIHTFSIFARNFSIAGVLDRSRLFPALLQFRAAWSAHMNLKIKMCSWLTLRSSPRPVPTWHVPCWWVDWTSHLSSVALFGPASSNGPNLRLQRFRRAARQQFGNDPQQWWWSYCYYGHWHIWFSPAL
jgi:hypothetical protein